MKPIERKPTWLRIALVAVLICAVPACSVGPAALARRGAVPNPPATPAENLERLTRLHERRAAQGGDHEYVLGPGDVLALRAFDFQELNRRVRVDGDGSITLPLLETVPVAGRTISAVQKDLTERLGAFMYDPHVTVFIEEYRSQQVAVVGAVEKPGLITLTNPQSSVLDAISAAGGMTASAAGRMYLIPGEGRAHVDIQSVAESLRNAEAVVEDLHLAAADAGGLNDALPLMFDSNQVPQGVESFFFNLPVRAGDVIMVPSSGHFIIEGWVGKPGTYPLKPGLTLRGALATAGGLGFPAATNRVRIYRLASNGEPARHDVNYRDIVAQRTPDVFIHEGDVIEVASSVKLVPYGVYKLVTDLVRFGASMSMIP